MSLYDVYKVIYNIFLGVNNCNHNVHIRPCYLNFWKQELIVMTKIWILNVLTWFSVILENFKIKIADKLLSFKNDKCIAVFPDRVGGICWRGASSHRAVKSVFIKLFLFYKLGKEWKINTIYYIIIFFTDLLP